MEIKHYHADNGRFADNAWLQDIEHKGQTQSFCGVGAHYQNGVAEKRIRDLQESARTMMLHAAHKWPKAHSTALWPYAIRTANDNLNATPRSENTNKSPIELFSTTNAGPRYKHHHTFGCPVYVLKDKLQNLNSVGKWNQRARIGIYLGQSPRHAQSIALVLNPRGITAISCQVR